MSDKRTAFRYLLNDNYDAIISDFSFNDTVLTGIPVISLRPFLQVIYATDDTNDNTNFALAKSFMQIITENLVQCDLSKKSNMLADRLFNQFVGKSENFSNLKKDLIKFAAADEPVFIIGESGTGKEIAAKLIHTLSKRNVYPFVPVNSATIPDTLAESELFGVTRGAYTDAFQRIGLFTAAHQGTLFLDDIDCLSMAVQAKLLRAVEQKTIIPLGSTHEISADIRLITASNKDIDALRKIFRPDFFYRICNLVLFLPPLRERKEDIPILLQHFASEMQHVPHMANAALKKIIGHDWPGNIRELKACYHRACILADDEILPEHILLF